jgi:hypothetical protein
LVLTLLGVPSNAQVDEAALGAAYIYNFTQFTSWPPGILADSKLVVCADPERALGMGLSRLSGRTVSGRVWTFGALNDSDTVAGCNVILLTRGEPLSAKIREVLKSDRPVLTISDSDLEVPLTVIRLYIEGDHLRFDIDNHEAVRRHLVLSSKLLQLARAVL